VCGFVTLAAWILAFSTSSTSWRWIGLLIGILAVLFAVVYVKLQVLNTLYRVYGDRVEIESGILTKKIENVALFRIRDIGLKQGFLGRILNFGDISLASTDASAPQMVIRGVDQPRELYESLRELISQSKAEHKTMIIEGDADQLN